ncbi:MAG: BREX-2 system phosphatase PglZ [Gammaproteobacteria bacterium]|nr:BREX-2 system phosphatase PglZ [Gammaproteobacteria bacterium]
MVINAIDDHLAKSDQLQLSWKLGTVRYLQSLLAEAESARRLVILTADHGHVLENSTTVLPGGEGERWRYGDGEETPAADERLFHGPRERALHGRRAVVLPAVERARYATAGHRRHGYHGGATPQEVLAPFQVWLPLGEDAPEGWHITPQHRPHWWEPRQEAPAPPPKRVSRKQAADKQRSLFQVDASPGVNDGASWIDGLLASPNLARQRQRLGRRDPGLERLRVLLETLDAQQGGPVPDLRLAEVFGLPPFRLAGLIANLQSVLNLDGYPVLSHDPGAEEVRLDVALATKQFEVN